MHGQEWKWHQTTASAGANYVYEVAHASDIAVNTPRSIGEVSRAA